MQSELLSATTFTFEKAVNVTWPSVEPQEEDESIVKSHYQKKGGSWENLSVCNGALNPLCIPFVQTGIARVA